MSEESNRRPTISNNFMPLDGLDLRGKDVRNNHFTYSGTNPPRLDGSSFTNNYIEFIGPAFNGLELFCFLSMSLNAKDKTAMLRSWGILSANEKIVRVDPDADDTSEDSAGGVENGS